MNKNKYYQSDMFDLIINQIKYLTNPPNYDLRESYINNNPFNIDIFTNETMIVDYRLNADNKQIAKLKRELNEDIITDRDVDLDVFIITMVQNFSIFTYKSSLTKHDTNLLTFLSAEKQLLMIKDVFLRYIKP